MAAEDATGNNTPNISEEILELELTEEDLRLVEAERLKEEARLAEIARLEAEAAERARLDAAWRDMEEKRFEYESMAQEKRLKARNDIIRFFRNAVLVGIAGAVLWQLSPFIMQFFPAPTPAAQPVAAQVPVPAKDNRGATALEEGMKLFDGKDFAKAAESFRQSAEQGNSKAQSNLGTMYAEGKGVVQDYQQAMSWYLKAAEQGSGESQTNLAKLYAEGIGVGQDYVEAAKWFQIAGTPNEEAKKRQAEVEKLMTQEQLQEAAQKATEWAKAHPR